MNQKKAKLLKKFVTASSREDHSLNYRRLKRYYNGLRSKAKRLLSEELRDFLGGQK